MLPCRPPYRPMDTWECVHPRTPGCGGFVAKVRALLGSIDANKTCLLLVSFGDMPYFPWRRLPHASATVTTAYFHNATLLPVNTLLDARILTGHYNSPTEISWEECKRLARETAVPWDQKINKILFVGNPNGRHTCDTRRRLFKLVENHPEFHVVDTSSAPEHASPFYSWQRYKFLLDIGGHVPWTDRTPFLMLCNSVVVHLPIITVSSSDPGHTVDMSFDAWHSKFFQPEIHFTRTTPVLAMTGTKTIETTRISDDLVDTTLRFAVSGILAKVAYMTKCRAGERDARDMSSEACRKAFDLDTPTMDSAFSDVLNEASRHETRDGHGNRMSHREAFDSIVASPAWKRVEVDPPSGMSVNRKRGAPDVTGESKRGKSLGPGR